MIFLFYRFLSFLSPKIGFYCSRDRACPVSTSGAKTIKNHLNPLFAFGTPRSGDTRCEAAGARGIVAEPPSANEREARNEARR
jgi:hypothetical protein